MHRFAIILAASAALACASSSGARVLPVPPVGSDDAAAGAALGRFARALEAGRFEEACALLSARWRQGCTPGRLALDFRGAGPWGRETVARVLARLAAGAPLERDPGLARLPTGEGRTALLILEPGGWRVDALEEARPSQSRR